MRSTGKPVEGHVEADSEEWAFHALANNGIITESLRPDPIKGAEPARPAQARAAETRAADPLLPPMMPVAPVAPAAVARVPASTATKAPPPPGTFHMAGAAQPPAQAFSQPAAGATAQATLPAQANGASAPPATRTQFDNALEGALDNASSQIDFDALTERYRGKKVWVIDRDKIRRSVARVVDQALSQSMGKDEGSNATRERVADAINELFKDSRNLTSQYSQTNSTLEKQIGRLASVIKQFEGALTTMQSAIRNIGSGGGGGGFAPRRGRGGGVPIGQRDEQNSVLLEIFKTNLDLLRGMEDEMRAASGAELDAVIADADAGAEGQNGESGGAPAPALAQAAAPDAGGAGAAESMENNEG